MKKRTNSKNYKRCFSFVKNFPVIMQVIILVNIFECYYPFDLTNWLYPILGHSILFDLLLLRFSRMFEFRIWHRLLIYSMLFNISIEWLYVNFDIPIKYDMVVGIILAITLILIILSLILRFKIGCTEDERKNFNKRAS